MAKRHGPGFEKIVNEARPSIFETTVQAIGLRLKNQDDFVLVDVREDSEWAKGHLPGAIHIGKGVIERDIEEKIPDQKADIVLYCGGGYRSALAALSLKKMGYINVTSMDGGFRGWSEAGFEVVAPK